MWGLRNFFHRHAAIGLLIVALAVMARALVPAGYMAQATPTGLTMALCSGVPGQTVTIALPADDGAAKHAIAKADSPCAFSALSQAGIAAADPILLAIAVVFIMSLGRWSVGAIWLSVRRQLRPPLRGPPLVA